MIFEDAGIKGIKVELKQLDEIADSTGFVRWQWEYHKATYDYEIEREQSNYYLRINTRAIEGRLESPRAVLEIEDAYLGKGTYPRGLDYNVAFPDDVLKEATSKLNQFTQQVK